MSGHDSCTQMRRQRIEHSTLNLTTGERSNIRTDWVTKPCGVPLFGDTERASGICRSCAKGWTHPENYPVPA